MIVKIDKQIGYLVEANVVYLIGTEEFVEASYEPVNPEDYGDNKPEKICNICHRILPTEEFQKNQNAKDNRQVRRPSCNDCRKKIDGIQMDSKEKKDWEANKPYLVPYTCPICSKTTIPGLTSKVVLNHDHKTGKITGWICDSCNTGLGRFRDDKEVLRNAISYLDEKGV
mgnify:CR=1 FL=1